MAVVSDCIAPTLIDSVFDFEAKTSPQVIDDILQGAIVVPFGSFHRLKQIGFDSSVGVCSSSIILRNCSLAREPSSQSPARLTIRSSVSSTMLLRCRSQVYINHQASVIWILSVSTPINLALLKSSVADKNYVLTIENGISSCMFCNQNIS